METGDEIFTQLKSIMIDIKISIGGIVSAKLIFLLFLKKPNEPIKK